VGSGQLFPGHRPLQLFQIVTWLGSLSEQQPNSALTHIKKPEPKIMAGQESQMFWPLQNAEKVASQRDRTINW